jgi:hypothetical protein
VCRHNTWCIPDEQYFGTLLSWKLAEDLQWGYTGDLTFQMGSYSPTEEGCFADHVHVLHRQMPAAALGLYPTDDS